MPEAMTTTTSTSAPAASASASSSSSSSFNPFKRRAQQKEGPRSSATEGGGTSRKFQRARTTQPPRSPDRPRNRAGSATATTGMSYQPADTPQRSTPAPRAAAAAATTTTTTPVPLPLPRRTPTPPPPPSSSSDPITQAHSSLTALQTQLDHLAAHFDLNPSTLYFSPPSTSNADPILPFVPQNASYHSYIEDLTRLLLKLDGIDSNGDQGVRQRRRGLVAAIERQLESVEAIKKGEWERRQKVQQELSDRKSKVDELMRGFRGGGEPATTSR
ncbi:BQ5605_C001g00237 [Microbotryum silenes-dioicae]|uniref:BQ5605_C001g00237 protein n=1 Tax=Microbotryum silenes-dioicae TaxID=796604 RepID=A0A2X0M6Z7_9BASI|nr:BQ5605_C001g00237 [Microbotryum silenes-dioicae]